MSVYHDEIEIEDFEFDVEDDTYYYPCPCGDKFQIAKGDLLMGDRIATCPSCSLYVRVIYDLVYFEYCVQKTEEEILRDNLKKLNITK